MTLILPVDIRAAEQRAPLAHALGAGGFGFWFLSFVEFWKGCARTRGFYGGPAWDESTVHS